MPRPGDGGDQRDEEYDPEGPGTTEPRDTLEMQVLSHELDDDDAQASDLEDAFDAALASSYPSARVDSPLGLPIEGTQPAQNSLEAAWAERDRLKSAADDAQDDYMKAECRARTLGERPAKATS